MAGGLEEITSSGASTTLTKYFGAQGLPTAERVGTNGPLSYLATDGQGTVSETLDGSGNVTSAQLYTPYGSVRYSSGSSPTSMGYTGQRADSATGLDYYHARYYDPAAGQFISADTVQDGPNPYGYVGGNPTTATDPSGHRLCMDLNDPGSCIPGSTGSSDGSGPPRLVSVADSVPTISTVTNSDHSVTTTRRWTETLTYSDGSVRHVRYRSSTTACDDNCKTLQDYDTAHKALEEGKHAWLAAKDVTEAVASFGALIADVVIAVGGDWVGAISALGDILALVTNILDFDKDVRLAGGESDADLAGLLSWLPALDALSGFVNLFAGVAGILSFGIGDMIKNGVKILSRELLPKIISVGASFLQGIGGLLSAPADYYDAEEAGLGSMSLPQLRDLCRRLSVTCS